MTRFPTVLPLLVVLAGVVRAQEPPARPRAVDAYTASASCSAFLPEDRPVCTDRLAEYDRTVARLEARRAQAGETEACLLHCELLEETWKLELDTQRWSQRAIRTMASGAYERRNEAMSALEARRARLLAEREAVAAELADLRRGRVIHLYEHTDTKAIVEHAGERFEAQSPLRYVGEKRVPHAEGGERRIAEREARMAVLDAELARVREEADPLATDPARAAGAEEMIQSMWGDVCTAAEAEAWLGARRAECRGGSRDPEVRACL